MKCTNCGKNNANCHYRYNINGKVTEAHLCADCAAKMGEDTSFFDTDRLFSSFFEPFDRMFDSFFRPMSFVPAFAIGPAREAAEAAQAEPAAPAHAQTDPELSRRREINALREQMLAAAEAEDYERAAELRDKIRDMEK